MMKKSVVKGDSLGRRMCGPRSKPRRYPRNISPIICPYETLNRSAFFWMCLISQSPVIREFSITPAQLLGPHGFWSTNCQSPNR